MKRYKNIIVIIPAYNEEKSVGRVVRGVLKQKTVRQCVVIDDGSTDSTKKSAFRARARILEARQNLGAGGATALGIEYAVKKKADIVVFMDADGQHDPTHIPELLQALTGGVDMVIGSRYIQKTTDSTSFIRKIGSGVISHCITLCFNTKIYDPTSGFRALNKRTITLLANHYPTVFPEPEVVIHLIKNGYTLKEISVAMMPRLYGKSSIGLIKAAGLMIYIIVTIGIERMKQSIKRGH